MSSILVIGEPGTGKSRAIKGLDPKTTVIIKPNNKPLPFPGWMNSYKLNSNMFMFKTFPAIADLILGPHPKKADGSPDRTKARDVSKGINAATQIKTVVIEDITHYFSKNVMDNAANKGYDKWTELAVLAFNNIVSLESEVRQDLDLIIIAHVEGTIDAAGNAEIGIQTPGKLMDKIIKIPSYFTYILHAKVDYSEDVPRYVFQTNRDNVRLAKSPELCFKFEIDNDYGYVLKRIHDYEQGKIDFAKEAEEEKTA